VKADLTDGLVGYWNFNEGTGSVAHDSSGNGNDGTINGATWTHRNFRGSFEFDGIDDYVQFSSPVLEYSPYSVCAWVYVVSLPTESAYLLTNGGQTRIAMVSTLAYILLEIVGNLEEQYRVAIFYILLIPLYLLEIGIF